MKSIIKMLKYEACKLFHNKLITIPFLIVFVVLYLVVVVQGLVAPLGPPSFISDQERAETLAYYEKQREDYGVAVKFYKNELEDGYIIEDPNVIGILQYSSFEEIQKRYKYYDFLLTTGTIDEDYYSGFSSDNRASYTMEMFLNIFNSVLPFFAGLITFYILRVDKLRGTEKNVAASPINRLQITLGKFLFLGLVLVGLFLVSLLTPFALGLSDLSLKTLQYSYNYFSKTFFEATFLRGAYAIFTAMLFWSGFATLCALIPKGLLAAFLPAAFFAGLQGLFYILDYNIGIASSTLFYTMPTVYIRYYLSPASDLFPFEWLAMLGVFIGVTAIYAAAVAIYIRVTHKKEVSNA